MKGEASMATTRILESTTAEANARSVMNPERSTTNDKTHSKDML